MEIDGDYGFKIFAGNKNGSVTIVTEFGNGLDSLEKDIFKFKQKINPQDKYHEEKLKYESHFRIFADKSISDEILKENIQKLTESEINQVFRVYKSEEYENLGYLKGERIKTIANNGYSK